MLSARLLCRSFPQHNVPPLEVIRYDPLSKLISTADAISFATGWLPSVVQLKLEDVLTTTQLRSVTHLRFAGDSAESLACSLADMSAILRKLQPNVSHKFAESCSFCFAQLSAFATKFEIELGRNMGIVIPEPFDENTDALLSAIQATDIPAENIVEIVRMLTLLEQKRLETEVQERKRLREHAITEETFAEHRCAKRLKVIDEMKCRDVAHNEKRNREMLAARRSHEIALNDRKLAFAKWEYRVIKEKEERGAHERKLKRTHERFLIENGSLPKMEEIMVVIDCKAISSMYRCFVNYMLEDVLCCMKQMSRDFLFREFKEGESMDTDDADFLFAHPDGMWHHPEWNELFRHVNQCRKIVPNGHFCLNNAVARGFCSSHKKQLSNSLVLYACTEAGTPSHKWATLSSGCLYGDIGNPCLHKVESHHTANTKSPIISHLVLMFKLLERKTMLITMNINIRIAAKEPGMWLTTWPILYISARTNSREWAEALVCVYLQQQKLRPLV